MTQFAYELACFIAYGLFLFGAALSFRDNGSRRSVAVMSLGVLADMAARLLPMTGIAFFRGSAGDAGSVISAASTFSIAVIWPAYFIAIFFWKQSAKKVFHGLIAAVELCWFAGIVLLLYGLYGGRPGP